MLSAGNSAAAPDQASAADAAREAAEREAVERAYVQVTPCMMCAAEFRVDPAMVAPGMGLWFESNAMYLQAWLAKAGVLEGAAAAMGSDTKPAAGDTTVWTLQWLIASTSYMVSACLMKQALHFLAGALGAPCRHGAVHSEPPAQRITTTFVWCATLCR